MLNLSQEAFGEKMGLSRQAVSKWEADGAVPEIDNLIAMSKLFGVTVGWLLGVEEDPAAQSPEPGLTEEQLRIVEQIARQYAAPERNRRNTQGVVGALALVMLAVCLVIFITYHHYVNQEFGFLSTQYYILRSDYSGIKTLLDQAMDRLDELAANERLLAEYSVEVEPWEDLTGATVRFTGIPNNTKAQDQVWLSVRLNGEEVASAMCRLDGSAYVTEVELPAANGYSYYLQAVHTGGDSSQQVLELDDRAVNLASALTGKIHAEVSQWGWNLVESYLHVGMEVDRAMPAVGSGEYSWDQIDLVILLNGQEIDRRSLLDESWEEVRVDREYVILTDASDCCSISHTFPVPQLVAGDEILLVLEYNGPAGVLSSRNAACLTVWNVMTGDLNLTEYAPQVP